jgi:hypothetical protein
MRTTKVLRHMSTAGSPSHTVSVSHQQGLSARASTWTERKKREKRKTKIELSLERASCRADRSPVLQRSRIEILPTNVAWRSASPSSKGTNPPDTHQSGSEQFEDVACGVDIPVPEVCLASTVGTAPGVPGELECDLLARDLGRGTRRRAVRHSAITERVDPRTTWSSTFCTCPRGSRRRCQARSSSVLSRSVVTRQVMNEVQSCSIVPALVEAARRRDGWAARTRTLLSVRW